MYSLNFGKIVLKVVTVVGGMFALSVFLNTTALVNQPTTGVVIASRKASVSVRKREIAKTLASFQSKQRSKQRQKDWLQ